MRKKIWSMAALLMPLSLLGSCHDVPNPSPSDPGGDPSDLVQPKPFSGKAYYEDVERRVGFEKESDIAFDENFSSGAMEDSSWWVLDGYWDAGGAGDWHNGVRSRNLFYVQDGQKTYLGVRARGSYCQDEDMAKAQSGMVKPEGACIMSKDFLYPGRYEIKMKAMPRQGAVTAMWTYYCKTGSEATSQNEIDIELGGNGQYQSQWCTTWTKHSVKETQDVDVSSLSYINDGDFHTYTFDWYTDYPFTHERRVDWFFDGQLLTYIEGEAVPETAMPLWVGLWCPSWAGTASFDTEYMLIENIAYTPFSYSSQYVSEGKGNPAYSHSDPSKSGIKAIPYEATTGINKLNNGGFESLSENIADGTAYSGWDLLSGKGSVRQSDDKTEGSHSLLVEDDGEGTYLGQTLPLAYEGFRYRLSIDVKKVSSQGKAYLEVVYGKKAKEKSVVELTGDGWKNYQTEIVMAPGAKDLSINLCLESGAKASFDNASLVYLGH